MSKTNSAPEPKPDRLTILQTSLQKKTAKVDAALNQHFADVKSANGQPLNDKRNGSATTARWNGQADTIRTRQREVAKTERAIETELVKLASVKTVNDGLPKYVLDMIDSGELSQWRRHPNTFFVPGVDKGRVIVDLKTGQLSTRYMSEVSKEQYPKFRDAVNKMLAMRRLEVAASSGL